MDEASRELVRAGTVEVEVEVDETTRKDRTRVDGEPGRGRDERLVESVRRRDAQFHRWRRHSPGVRSTRSVGGLGDDGDSDAVGACEHPSGYFHVTLSVVTLFTLLLPLSVVNPNSPSATHGTYTSASLPSPPMNTLATCVTCTQKKHDVSHIAHME